MQVSISVGSAYSSGDNWPELVDFVTGAEALGVDEVWSAEAWGTDAVVPLAYLAARTSRVRLGTGIIQISSRVPAMIAMTAQTLDTVTGGRFMLGLGVSGPQVVEGLHGAAFDRPLTRLRETVEIIRLALSGEKLEYAGKYHVLPRPGGEGKALRLAQRPRPDLPIYLATLGPRAMELTGELADGWLGTSFIPEQAEVFLAPMRAGAGKAGRSLDDLRIQVASGFVMDDDVERLIEARRPAMAFQLGAMGSARTNFYNQAYQRAGYAEDALAVQTLWVQGKREEAVRRVPDEMILKSGIIGNEAMVRERLRVYRDAGVTGIRLAPEGADTKRKLAALEQSLDVIRREVAEW